MVTQVRSRFLIRHHNDPRSKVDVEHFEEAAKEIEEVLATKLYAVATHPGELGECFRDAQGLVESAGALLGCPENEQDGCVTRKYARTWIEAL